MRHPVLTVAVLVVITALVLFIAYTLCACYGWFVGKVLGLDTHASAMAGGWSGLLVSIVASWWKKETK